MVDSYYAVLMFTLSMIKNKNAEYQTLSKRIQWLAENLYEERVISYFESCNQQSIQNAIQ